jgi:hypothetical protein
VKLFVLGHGRHGKDTVAKILHAHYGLTFRSSSEFVMVRAVWPFIGRDYGTPAECFADRHNRRREWFDLISAYNRDDPARLARELFSEYDMYVGLRNCREFLAARELADLAIWVDASKRHLLEPADSMTVRSGDCDVIIDNNGTEEALERRVMRLGVTLRL